MICRCATPHEHNSRSSQREADNSRAMKRSHEAQIKALEDEIAGLTIKANDFEILRADQVGGALVMKVKYPSCKSCEFEGVKVLVFLYATPLDALRWRRIDPHFRKVTRPYPPNEAPPPSARFPNTPTGWTDAVAYARGYPLKEEK